MVGDGVGVHGMTFLPSSGLGVQMLRAVSARRGVMPLLSC
jgi:hypothetical protein